MGKGQLFRSGLVMLCLMLAVGMFGVSPALAAEHVVATNTDAGAGSLRQAIANAVDGDTITFNLTAESETISISTQLVIGKGLIIDGSNDAGSGVDVTVKMTANFRVFDIAIASADKTVTIKNLTITGGNVSGVDVDGGGILFNTSYATVTLNLENCTIRGNTASRNGAGLYQKNSGVLNLVSCTFSNNTSAENGGGVFFNTSQSNLTLNLENCTITGNTASGHGGGLYQVNGVLSLDGCTVSNNTAESGNGGGLYQSNGVLNLDGCTVSNNTAGNRGGGLNILSGTATIRNSTISGNTGSVYSGGIGTGQATLYLINTTISGNNGGTNGPGGFYNSKEAYLLNTIVINNTGPAGKGDIWNGGVTTSAYYSWYNSVTGSISGNDQAPNKTDAFTAGDLGPLQNNGGPTYTMALSSSAPAFQNGAFAYYNPIDGNYFYDNQGIPTAHKLTDWATFTPSDPEADITTTDQRGAPRGTLPSIGAFAPAIYRSKTSGNWSEASTWELSQGETWSDVAAAPDRDSGSITIRSGHIVTVDAAHTSTNLTVEGTLTIAGVNTLDNYGTFDATGGAVTFAAASALTLHGPVTSLGTLTAGTGTVVYSGTSAQTIGGATTFYNLTIDNADEVNASSATSLKVDNQLTVSTGTYTSKSDYHHVSIAAGATLALSGDITVSGDWSNSGTFTHNDHGVTLDGTDQALTGTTTFYDLTKTVASAATLTFEAGSTTTIANALILQGSAGQLLSLRSSTDGTQWSIDPQGDRTIGYLDVKDSQNIHATDIQAGAGSVDSGNNIKWNFPYPVVTTEAASNIGITTATGNGNITSLGTSNPTAHGVCWSTTANPTTSDSKTNEGAASATGAFTSSMTGLTAGTTYHYRAYATNTAGTSYGGDQTFSTSPMPSPTPHSVLYNGNGNTSGTVPVDPNTYAETATVTVLDNTGSLVKTGSVFAGWNSQANGGGSQYAPGTTFSMPANDVTLYAQWSSSAVTIDPTEKEHAPEAMSGQTVDVTAGEGASWTATSNVAWLTLTNGTSGTGNGQVTYSLTENGHPNGPRIGTISVADKTCTVTQGSFDSVFTDGPAAGCEIEIPNRQAGDPYILYMNSQNAGGTLPIGTTFPWGLLDFKIVNVPSGGTVTLVITTTSNILAGSIFYKYDFGTYTPYGGVTGLDDGDNRFTITLADGGTGDQDGTVNGEIVDPGGIGVLGAHPIPALSEWGMIILASILVGLNLWQMRRQGMA